MGRVPKTPPPLPIKPDALKKPGEPELVKAEGTRFIYVPFEAKDLGERGEKGHILDGAEKYLKDDLPEHSQRRIQQGKVPHEVLLCVEGHPDYEKNMEALKNAGPADTVYVLAHGSERDTRIIMSTEREPAPESPNIEAQGGPDASSPMESRPQGAAPSLSVDQEGEMLKPEPSIGVPMTSKGLADKMKTRVGEGVGKIKIFTCFSGLDQLSLKQQNGLNDRSETQKNLAAIKPDADAKRAQDPKHSWHSFAHHFNEELKKQQLFKQAEVRGYAGSVALEDPKVSGKAVFSKLISEDGKVSEEMTYRAKDKAVNFPAKNRRLEF